MNDVVAAFHEYFEIIDADSPELLREVFRLRYQVLCIEQRLPGFDAALYPAGHEYDSFDEHSSHILLQHRPSGDFVGTARLILPDPRNPQKPFPIEQHTQFDPALFDIDTLNRSHAAEISRLLIIRRFRRRKTDGSRPERDFALGETVTGKKRRFPHPILALVVGIIHMSSRHNVTQCFSVMDPSLNRLLSPYGLQFDAIGPLTDYHGPRRPYFIDLIGMLERTYLGHHDIWELITNFGSVRIGPQGGAHPPPPSYQASRS